MIPDHLVIAIDYFVRSVKSHFVKNPSWRFRNGSFSNMEILSFCDGTLVITWRFVVAIIELREFLFAIRSYHDNIQKMRNMHLRFLSDSLMATIEIWWLILALKAITNFFTKIII